VRLSVTTTSAACAQHELVFALIGLRGLDAFVIRVNARGVKHGALMLTR